MKVCIELSIAELNSSAWIKVERFLKDRLQKNRERLEGNLNIEETNITRARISDCKELLACNPNNLPAESRAEVKRPD